MARLVEDYDPQTPCPECGNRPSAVDATREGDDVTWTCPDCGWDITEPAWAPDEDLTRGGDR